MVNAVVVRFVFFILVFLIALYGAGFAAFYVLAYPVRTAAHIPLGVQGLAVFTGGEGRVEAALQHMAAGFSGPVIITGVNAQVKQHELLGDITLTPAQLSLLTLDYTAQTTADNVQVMTQWAAAQGITNIGIITAHYHMPRVQVLLNKADVPLQTTLLPVVPQKVNAVFWWREYNKYIFSLVVH